MPRAYPAAFQNKDTYGVNTDKNRDRLPELDTNLKGSLSGILVGGRQVPIRMCLAALRDADTTEEVARLVIGAVLDASATPATVSKIQDPHVGAYVEALKQWATPLAFPDDDHTPPASEVPEDGAESAPKEATVKSVHTDFPTDLMPEWLNEIDFEKQEFVDAWTYDPVELCAYAAVLAFCIGKQPQSDNLEAFNQKRRNAVAQYMTKGELKIFVDDSPHLSLEVLGKVHRAFNLIIQDRAQVFSAIVDRDTALVSGTARMFYVIFRLSAGSSLNPLLIITRFARKYPHLYAEFPDLETEYHAAAHALQRFYDAPEKRRMYLKLIFGSAYVPVDRNDVDGLLGVAVFALQQSEQTLANYRGGKLNVAHREKLITLLEVAPSTEEQVPEETAE